MQLSNCQSPFQKPGTVAGKQASFGSWFDASSPTIGRQVVVYPDSQKSRSKMELLELKPRLICRSWRNNAAAD